MIGNVAACTEECKPRRRGRPRSATPPSSGHGAQAKKSRCYEKEYSELRSHLASLKQQLKQAQSELEPERNQRQTLLRGDLRALQADHDELNIKYDSLVEENKLMRRLRQDSRASAAQLQEENNDLRNKLDEMHQAHAAELERARTAHGVELSKLRAAHASEMKRRCREREKTRARNVAKRRSWAESEATMQQQIQQLQATIAELEADVSALRWKLSADARRGSAERREASRRVEKASMDALQSQRRADEQVALAEERMAEAEDRAKRAEERADAEADRALAEEATSALLAQAKLSCEQAVKEAQRAQMLAKLRADRMKDRANALTVQLQSLPAMPGMRSADDWAAMTRASRYKAIQRERTCLSELMTLNNHVWRVEDVASVLQELGLLRDVVLKTRDGFRIFFTEVQLLMKRLEEEEFGRQFGLLLHFDMHLTIPKILRLTQAASKAYSQHEDRYISKVLLGPLA